MTEKSIWDDLQGVAFRQGYVDAGGIRTRFLQSGREGAPVLLFLHGSGGHAEAYTRNLAAHGEHFNTFAIDLMGHGYSDKPDYDYTIPLYVKHVIGFLDAIGAKTVSLSGESLGGWVSSHVALAHPERIERLVLNTAGADKVGPAALQTIREMTTAAVNDPSSERLRARLEWLMHHNWKVTDDLVASRRRIYEQAGMQQAIAHVLSMATPEARKFYALTDEQWAQIKHPTLVLWTDNDPTATVAVGEDLHSKLPNSQFVVMKDCGHWPQFEDAETFNRIHIEFLLGKRPR